MKIDILQGDSLTVLRTLPAESVHCCVTSPPYWGLRDYGTARWDGGNPFCTHTGHERWYTENSAAGAKGSAEAFSTAGPANAERLKKARWRERGVCTQCGAVHYDQQIGLERSLGDHIGALVELFREVRRVLRKDGTLWLNYGDAYASSPNGRSAADTKAAGNDDRTFRDKPISTVGPILQSRPGDAERHGKSGNKGASQTIPGSRAVAGGTLKPKDRMLLPARVAIALQDDGWWVRDEIIWHKPNPMPSSVKDRTTPAHEMIYMLTKSANYYFEPIREPVEAAVKKPGARSGVFVDRIPVSKKTKVPGGWDKGDGAHGTIHRDGRTPAEYIELETDGLRNKRSVWSVSPAPFAEAHFATFPPKLIEPCILAGCPWGGTVLDPFGGAGTTGLVARANGRNSILIELNPAYIEIANRRLFPTAFPWTPKMLWEA